MNVFTCVSARVCVFALEAVNVSYFGPRGALPRCVFDFPSPMEIYVWLMLRKLSLCVCKAVLIHLFLLHDLSLLWGFTIAWLSFSHPHSVMH